jgi:hypothetical protein
MASKNTGERDELIAILNLIDLKDKGIIFNGEIIQQIRNGSVECKSLPRDVNIQELQNLSDSELNKLANASGVTKAPSGAKSDVEINGVGYSIKSNRSAPPAIVNHTARPGFFNVCSKVNSNVELLDNIIDEYWELRMSKKIGEDVKNTDEQSPFRDHKEYFRPILNYFLFTGSGSGDSSFPSDFIIQFDNPLNPNEWHIYDKSNALDLFWERLVFSLRSKKGMPTGYPDQMTPRMLTQKSSIARWTNFIDGDYRGALHIRSSK